MIKLLEAALVELNHAPCRDNTLCLKCDIVKKIEELCKIKVNMKALK